MNERIFLLGVPIDSVTHLQALARVRAMLVSDGQHHVMTPNPEMLVEAVRNPAFRDVLSRSALNVPDGFGLLLVARMRGTPLRSRVTGTDLLQSLCADSDAPPIFLLGSAPGVAEMAAKALQKQNASLRIAGVFAGRPLQEDAADIIRRINASGANLLFVAYGAPAQDIWIHQHLPAMPGVRVAMGVGGAFDFLAGVRTRAPGWMRTLGIEWVWRLAQEPLRLRRIVRAVIVFPWMALTRAHAPSQPSADARSA